jgi:hypothetical protein
MTAAMPLGTLWALLFARGLGVIVALIAATGLFTLWGVDPRSGVDGAGDGHVADRVARAVPGVVPVLVPGANMLGPRRFSRCCSTSSTGFPGSFWGC